MPDSILNIGNSWDKYKKYVEITITKHVSGEGKMKAANVTGQETGLRCWIKDEGYADIEIEYKKDDNDKPQKVWDKTKTKILVSYKHRLPSRINEDGKIVIDYEKRFRYVEPQWIKGGKFKGVRHEWEKGKEMEQNGLTRHARHTLKLASNCINTVTKMNDHKTNFITLTYGRDVPSDKIAKQHLKQFFQRLHRHFGKKFHYIWSAEMQLGKEGSYRDINGAAIHFHALIDRQIIITEKQRQQFKNVYIPDDLKKKRCEKRRDYAARLDQLKWVNYHWNDIVNKWQSANNLPIQTITRTDCEIVNDAGKYISKYISKEEETILGRLWGIADITRELIKPTEVVKYHLPIKYAEKIMQEAIALFYDDNMCLYDTNEKGEYIPKKSVNYICVTDKTSNYFNKEYTPKEYDELNAPAVTNYEEYKTDLKYRHEHKERETSKELYQHIPDYPIAWSNNIELLQDYLESTIEYYDTYKYKRKNVRSLVYMFD